MGSGGKGRRGWRLDSFLCRRLVQAAFFAAFVFLLLRTEFRGSPVIRYPVNVFFQLDPYLAAAVMISARAVVSLFWPAILVLLATLLLGRVFCGWFCPMGALLDFAGRWRRGSPFPVSPPLGRGRHLKYYLLAASLAAAAFGMQWAWMLDPFSILSRAFSVSVIPAANLGLNAFFDFTYRHLGWASAVTEPVYAFLRRHVLTFDQQYFQWGGASLAVLLLVLLLELRRPRFWCRYVCPLGAAVSALSAFALLRRRVGDGCVDCGACYERCPLGLIDGANHRDSGRECSACLDCRRLCPHEAVAFAAGRRGADATPDISRRRLLGSALAGAAAVPFLGVNPWRKLPAPALVRPPGSLEEGRFLEKCVRCGSCMKVCLGNAIHPALLEAGPEGLMTPMMHFRLGYCEYNCTLCGQVCPTGAIRRLGEEEKRGFKIGEAFIDQNRCLPYAQGVNCIVCEEHCPVPSKAIRFEEATVVGEGGVPAVVKRPRVLRDLCIGCGICETKCPLRGKAAIAVTPQGETRGGDR